QTLRDIQTKHISRDPDPVRAWTDRLNVNADRSPARDGDGRKAFGVRNAEVELRPGGRIDERLAPLVTTETDVFWRPADHAADNRAQCGPCLDEGRAISVGLQASAVSPLLVIQQSQFSRVDSDRKSTRLNSSHLGISYA